MCFLFERVNSSANCEMGAVTLRLKIAASLCRVNDKLGTSV